MRAGGRQQQRVAVGRRLGREVGADGAAGARLVVDDQRRAQLLAHLLRQGAREEVGGAAGRERHDQADRLAGPGLLRPRGGQGRCTQRQGPGTKERGSFHFHGFDFDASAPGPLKSKTAPEGAVRTAGDRAQASSSWKASSRLDFTAGSSTITTSSSGRDQQAGRDRPRDEHAPVAARQQQRAPQVLFHHRPQDEAQQQRRRLAAQLDEHVADDAEDRHHPDVEGVVVGRVHADRAEQHDGREQPAVGNGQQLDPDADQRQVQDDQHQVADPHRGDQAPEQLAGCWSSPAGRAGCCGWSSRPPSAPSPRWAECPASAAG